MQHQLLDVGGHAQPQPFASSISANEWPITEETSAEGRGGIGDDRNDSGASSPMMRTGTKGKSAGNGPNTPSRASFRHSNS